LVYSLYVAGTSFSGKTALILGLYGKFQEMGLRVGYFKPVSQGLKMVEGLLRDPDVLLMKEAMDLSESLDEISPTVIGKRYLDSVALSCEGIKGKIIKAFEKVSENKDVLLIESPASPELFTCCGLDVASLSREFRSKVLFAVKGEDDIVAEKAILYKIFIEQKGGEMLGVVLNFVPFQQLERMRGVVSATLENCSLSVLGIVPDQRELTQPLVQDIVDALNAEVLAGMDKLDTLVDDYLIGAMTPESAMSWLRRSVGKALITGGDRSDLILMALETKPSAVILTGNIYPSKAVLNVAEEKSIPIILVSDDTYTTVMKLEMLTGRIAPSPISSKKIQLTRKIIGEYVDWKRILDEYVKSKEERGRSKK